MNKIIIIIIFLTLGLKSHGQEIIDDPVFDSYSNQTTIQGLKSVTLKNGFFIPKGNTVTISIAAFPMMVSNPVMQKNYVLTKTFKQPGVNLENLSSTRTLGDENQTIQYFDNLGRLDQVAQIMASPSYGDIVQRIEYDNAGRESTKYLPYPAHYYNGIYRSDAKAAQENFYKIDDKLSADVIKTEKPFAVTVFEKSPLNRVLEQGAPGEAWQPMATAGTGHTVKTTYGTNTEIGNDVVKLWNVIDGGASSTSNYPLGKLNRTTVRDENTINITARVGSVDEYRDFEDKVILKRVWETETKTLNTYYIYDDIGNLRYVIPPAVVASEFSEQSDPNFNNYIYGYKYDVWNRLIEKKIPGKGADYLVYNKSDKLVLTQDSLQRKRNEWTYNRYDAFGRITSTGLYTNSVKKSLKEVQQLVDGSTGPLWETRNGTDYPANSTTFPLAGSGITIKPRIINYYDDYSFTGASALPPTLTTQSKLVKSLPTGSVVYKVDGTLPLLTVMYYDDKGNIIQTASANHLGGKDYITNTYSFVGELETSTRVHAPSTGAATKILTKNVYDHAGRLSATKEKINLQDEVTLVSNNYNEIGQLKTVGYGKSEKEASFVNIANLSYNERGWLTKSISPKFSHQLKYNDGTNPQWNGNISQQFWGNDGTLPNAFTYKYDKINRLTSGISTLTGAASMSETIVYDELGMGNFKSLKRDALAVTTYTYEGNKLIELTGGIKGTYIYDGNGNTVKDRSDMNFSYNYLNLPQAVTKTGISVSYIYDATGTKLSKKAEVGTIKSTREYVDGIEYNDDGIDIIHNTVGYALRSGTNYVYHYNLTDHLGNVRATLKRGSSATAVDVTQRDNYYPFGKQKVVAGGNNKYLYNGKETQSELGGQYDYGARFYDAEIGRWNVVDPLAEQMRVFSPYVYGNNNPIRFIDPDGRKGQDWIKWKASTGTTYYTYDREVHTIAEAKAKNYTNVEWVKGSASVNINSGGSYDMKTGANLTKVGTSGKIDLSTDGGLVVNKGKIDQTHFNIAKSGMKQVSELLNYGGDAVSYIGMATGQKQLVAVGGLISLPGGILEKVDDMAVNNYSANSWMRTTVSFGVDLAFEYAGKKAANATRIVAGKTAVENGSNFISEFTVENLTGIIGKIFNKSIDEKLKIRNDEH